MEPDYLPCVQMSCFNRVWTPYPNGGACPPTTTAGGSRGGGNYYPRPPGGGSGVVPPKGFFYEKCLVKYCNFGFNLDHSLCHRYDGRSYVNLPFFTLEGNPLLYEGFVL